MPLIDPVTMLTNKKEEDKDTTNTDTTNGDVQATASAAFEPPSDETKNEWLVKLLGKTVHDEDHSEIVRLCVCVCVPGGDHAADTDGRRTLPSAIFHRSRGSSSLDRW